MVAPKFLRRSCKMHDADIKMTDDHNCPRQADLLLPSRVAASRYKVIRKRVSTLPLPPAALSLEIFLSKVEVEVEVDDTTNSSLPSPRGNGV